MAGRPVTDDGWLVTVEQPDPADGVLCTLAISGGGVATSSTRSRRWVLDGVERHHQIDPRTGRPSTTDLAAVTVIARAGWLAEVHATAALAARQRRRARLPRRARPQRHRRRHVDGTVLMTADLAALELRPSRRRCAMSPQFWWFLTRASGIVAWLMLTLSVIWGILLSTKAFPDQRRPVWLLAVHRWLAGLTMSFLAIHLVALVADSYVQLRARRHHRPVRLRLEAGRGRARRAGDVAARRRRTDVARHAAPAPAVLAGRPPVELRRVLAHELHAAFAGTDATQPLYQVTAAASILAVAWALMYRVANRRAVRRAARADGAAANSCRCRSPGLSTAPHDSTSRQRDSTPASRSTSVATGSIAGLARMAAASAM